MHRKSIFLADADDDIAKNGASAIVGLDLDTDDISVLNAVFFRILGCHMNVSLGDNHAFFTINLVSIERIDKCKGSAAFSVAAFTNRDFRLDGTSFSQRNLNLISATDRPKDGKVLERIKGNALCDLPPFVRGKIDALDSADELAARLDGERPGGLDWAGDCRIGRARDDCPAFFDTENALKCDVFLSFKR